MPGEFAAIVKQLNDGKGRDMEKTRVAVVTGASRGLGLGISHGLAEKGYRVVMVARDGEKLAAAAEGLRRLGLTVDTVQADVSRQAEVDALAAWVQRELGRADVLVNNAGVLLEPKDFMDPEPASAFKVKPEWVEQTLAVNTLGPFRMCQALIPLMAQRDYGRVVNLSSGMGQLSDMGGYWPGYRMSKTALNTLTRVLATELAGSNIKVNSVCPGWVRTDMGGPHAERSVEQAVPGILWAATLPDDGPTGGFFRDGQVIPW